jgi:uncharacterized protein (TIGR03000 family)
MFRQTVSRGRFAALAGLCLLVAAGQAEAQQGWPVAGANWDLYGGAGGGSSNQPSAPSYAPSYQSPAYGTSAYSAPAYNPAIPPSVSNAVASSYRPVSPEGYSYTSATEPDGNRPARVNFRVPGDAKVWFGASPTTSTGTSRSFESPALDVGQEYVYRIRVEWMQDGKNVTETRQVPVHAGDVINLTMGNSSHAATTR